MSLTPWAWRLFQQESQLQPQILLFHLFPTESPPSFPFALEIVHLVTSSPASFVLDLLLPSFFAFVSPFAIGASLFHRQAVDIIYQAHVQPWLRRMSSPSKRRRCRGLLGLARRCTRRCTWCAYPASLILVLFANVAAVLGSSAQIRPSYLINGLSTLRALVRTSRLPILCLANISHRLSYADSHSPLIWRLLLLT